MEISQSEPKPEKKSLRESFTKLPEKLLTAVRNLRGPRSNLTTTATLAQIAQEEIKEKAVREIGLGRLFQDNISQLSESELPPFISEADGAAGLLSTNEDLPDLVVGQVRQADNAPNGYIFGAGVGNIFSMPLLYPEGQMPRAILCVDIVPEVVLTGRVFTQLLSESSDFRSLNTQMQNDQVLRRVYDQALSSETNEEIRSRLRTATPEQVIKGLHSVIDHEYLPTHGHKQSVPFDHTQRMSVLAVIRDNFGLLHNLAQDGNIGVGYADMTSDTVLNTLNSMPDFSQSRNIVYMSNVIDHLTKRGTDLTHIDDMMSLTALGEGKERGNWFVDTTQKSLDYKLRASNTVPVYEASDLTHR